MQNLKQKIKDTTLLSDEDKIAILVVVDTYSSDDINGLEAIIDEFDAKHKEAISEYKKSVYGVLDSIISKANTKDVDRYKKASGLIKTGIQTFLS